MAEQEVKNIFDTNTDAEISREYTKNDLEKIVLSKRRLHHDRF